MFAPPRRARSRRLAVAAAIALVAVATPACSKDDKPGVLTPGEKPGILAPGEKMPKGITVTSTAFGNGEPIPERFSCEGENVPPPLAWKGVPASATELALVIEDPDAPDGIFVHWLVVHVDAGAGALNGTGPPPGAEVLPGSSDNPTYIGPCPPDGDGAHRYFFEVYALRQRPALVPTSSPVDKVRAVRKAAVAGGSLVGTFTR